MQGLLSNKIIKIPLKKFPRTEQFSREKVVFYKIELGFQNFGYAFFGVGGYVYGDFADFCAGNNPLMSMVERVDPPSLLRRGDRTPIGTSEIFTT